MNHPTSNNKQQQNQRRRIVPPTRLSDILSPSSATKIIGQETCRVIIRNFLRSQISPVVLAGGQDEVGTRSWTANGQDEVGSRY